MAERQEKKEFREIRVKNKKTGATFVVKADEGTVKRLKDDENIEFVQATQENQKAAKATPEKK